jgi:hypothetical protein
MIRDLVAHLAVAEMERLFAPSISRDEADASLADLNARLSPMPDDEQRAEANASAPECDPEAEARLLTHYLRLSVDDLEEITPPVHEWLLERLSQSSDLRRLDDHAVQNLRNVYFLFPETTVRHAVVGVMLRTDREGSLWRELAHGSLAVASIWQAINQRREIPDEDRIEELRLLADVVMDYIDVFPEQVARSLAAFCQENRHPTLFAHLRLWADRFGPEHGSWLRDAVSRGDERS